MEAALLSGSPYRPRLLARGRAGAPKRQLQGDCPERWQLRTALLLPPDAHQEALRHAAGLFPQLAGGDNGCPAAAGDAGGAGSRTGEPAGNPPRPAGCRAPARHSATTGPSGTAGGELPAGRAGSCQRPPRCAEGAGPLQRADVAGAGAGSRRRNPADRGQAGP